MTTSQITILQAVRVSPLLACLACVPAQGMDVKMTFYLPKSMGSVEASFSGFDNNLDGVIGSSAGEVTVAWSSVTGPWILGPAVDASKSLSGVIDIKYEYGLVILESDSGYPGDEFFGLDRFIIETKVLSENHVNTNRLDFRGENRFGFFSASGISWSDAYNAPSSYSYTFEGPENAVRLSLAASGSPFAPPVPEPSTFWIAFGGLLLVLTRSKRLRSSERQHSETMTG